MSPVLLPAHNPGPMTGAGNNTYLFIAGDQATLIDAGVGKPEHLADIQKHLDAARARLTAVLVTHGHPDHISGAPALAAAHSSAGFLKYPWPQADAKYPVSWDALADGDRFPIGDRTLTSLHTPGHSPDHMAFWDEADATVYSADLVIRGGTVMIHASGGGNLKQYLTSLERIRSLEPRRLLPAHGPEITSPATLIDTCISHRLEREAQVVERLAAGRDTVESITESIYDGLSSALMPAARETVRAHLEKLKEDGRAFEENGRWHT